MSRHQDREYFDIPGTVTFDLQLCQKGYALNKFCNTLNKPENREQFLADEHAFINQFPLSDEVKTAIKKRDLNRLLELGGNIYFLWKIAATIGVSMPYIGGLMNIPPVSEQEFTQMMIQGGRKIDGNRSIKANKEQQKDG